MNVGLIVILVLVSHVSSNLLGQRRGRGRGPGRGFKVQRGSRELAGYGGGGGGGQGQFGGGGQSQYGGDEEDCGDGDEEEGVDFGGCQDDPETGFCCVEKKECVSSLEKDPILECTHKNVEQCHYTYVTQFTPAQEEVCEENFEKICSITFKQQAYNETVEKCYTPVEKVCNGQGEEECRTVYESSCTTRYVEKSPGKFVADTKCEKLPTELCGAGCSYEEGQKECHEKILTSLVDIPEEVCDLNPQKTCRYATKLVPKLKPEHECTIVPKETCTFKFTTPRQVKKPLLTKWCLDPSEPLPGESYEEENAYAPVLGSGSAPASYGVPPPSRQSPNNYEAPSDQRDYSSPEGNYAAPSGDYSSPAEESYGAPSYSEPRQSAAPVYKGKSSKRKGGKKQRKGGRGKQGAQKYLAPSNEIPNYDYEETPIDYTGPVQPAVQAARDFSTPSNSYGSPASDEYGGPSQASDNYGSPDLERDYSAPGDSYGSPSGASDEYGAPPAEYSSPRSTNTEYSAPRPATGGYNSPRTASGEYSAPRTSPDRDYNAPSSPANSDYNAPNTPANRDYSAPKSKPSRNQSPNRGYSSPSSANDNYGAPSQASYNAPQSPSNSYNSPSNAFSGQSNSRRNNFGATSKVSIDFGGKSGSIDYSTPLQPVYNSIEASASYNSPQYASLDGAPQTFFRKSKSLRIHRPFRPMLHG